MLQEKDSKLEHVPSTVRKTMKEYWEYRATEGSNIEIMLCERDYLSAERLHSSDVLEITSVIPDLTGMDVLEVAGGSGRLSGELAKRAKHVTTTDFIESFVEENKKINGPKFNNMTFRTVDAMKLDYPQNTFDMVFSVWLFMYLSDEEVESFLHNVLKMLRPGGYIFFRESHFKPVGDRVDSTNPTKYRSLKEYCDIFKKCRWTGEQHETYFFDFIHSGNSGTYIHYNGAPNLIHYLLKKTKLSDVPSLNQIQQQLDNTLYNEGCMQVYNKIIGDGFTTPGGLQATKELVSKLDLKPGSKVLDVGCGLGGLTCYLTKEYDVDVAGLELSLLASQAAILKFDELGLRKGQMYIADVTQCSFSNHSFDVIYVRETIEYLGDKTILMTKFLQWLKPCGQLLVGDYCLCETTLSDPTAALIQKEGLQLVSVDSYMNLLEKTGYTNIRSEDYSAKHIEYLKQNLSKLCSTEEIIDDVKMKFITLWQSLISALEKKDLTWMVFMGFRSI